MWEVAGGLWAAVHDHGTGLAVLTEAKYGSTPAVLVDRPVRSGRLPDRGIDWYDISELEFEASDPR